MVSPPYTLKAPEEMKRSLPHGRMKYVFYDFLACATIILFHFTNYLIYTEYDRIYPDILIVGAGLSAIAAVLTVLLQVRSTIFRAAIFAVLITFVLGDALFEFGTKDDVSLRLIALFVTMLLALAVMFFLREHANLVLIGGFFAMLAATVGVGMLTGDGSDAPPVQTADNDELPVVVHIVLDEHIGLAGLPAGVPGAAAIARASREFYGNAGFRIFAGAYSQFFRTETALAGALNFDLTARAGRFLSRKHYGFSLNENAYLKTYAEKGYRIRVYQSDYLDFCKSAGVGVRNCSVYRPDFLSRSAISGLPASERARLLFGMYYSSVAVMKIVKLAEKSFRDWLSGRGLTVPPLGLWHGRVGPIAVAPTVDRLIRDVSLAKGGTAFFAHLLMPHYPYVYDSDCAVRSPISKWRLRQDRNLENTPESRRLSYIQYFEQIGCVEKRLSDLFSAMKRANTFDRATIIVHGDHGSRIGLADPGTAIKSILTPVDYADAFSTLFALKAPGVRAGLDSRMLPLASLMRFAADRDNSRLSAPPKPSVFVGEAALPVALPAFPTVRPQTP